MLKKFDYLIIGGGIVGLSIGLELLKLQSKPSVLVVEKEIQFGVHASGRNSGVLHAGFYYSPDSLKAKFCLDGNYELKTLIKNHNLPILNCGKIVVAKGKEDLPRMHQLLERGLANGVNLLSYPASQIERFEPLAATHEEFLWSPDTSVSDPLAVGNLIKNLFLNAGGQIQFGSEIQLREGQNIYLSGNAVDAEQIINASGTNAVHLAHQNDAGLQFEQLPVLGRYKVTSSNNLPLRTLVYPVPNPTNPFLGVHFTLTVSGAIKIGPTAIPIIGKEQYKFRDIPALQDFKSSGRAIKGLFSSSPINLLQLAITELPKISTKRLVSEAMELVPSVSKNIKWNSKSPGIRAQLVNMKNKSFEMDYVVEQNGKFTHILNAVSPGWTSAIPFAKYVVKNFLA